MPSRTFAACFVSSLALVSCTKPPVDVPTRSGCNPFATTTECLYPFPSGFFQTADATSSTGFRNAYPAGIFGVSSASPPVPVDVTLYNTADGIPPASPLLMFFGQDVDLSNLPRQTNVEPSVQGAPIALLDLETGTLVPYFAEMDEQRKPGYTNRYAFIVRPAAPMAMGHRHGVIVTDQVKLANGEALPVSAAFAALRDGTITTNPVIEGVRGRYDQIFDAAAKLGYPRAHVALAWDFMVASESYLLGPILSMRSEALQEVGANGEGYANNTFAYTIDTVKTASTGGTLVEGNFEVPTYLNSSLEFDWDSNHLPIRQPVNNSYQYTMYIPAAALQPGASPFPLAVFGHGLFGTGRSYLDTDGSSIAPTIDGMADRAGGVLIATDWIGLSGNTNVEIALQVGSNINQLGEITDELTQSLINNLVMTKLARGALQNDPQVKPADHVLLDPSLTYYYGVSLGGIQGASYVSISDEISRGVLAVPGAAWSTMFPRSVDWTQFYNIAEGAYPDPLQEITLLSLMQARFDFTDGTNLTKLMLKEPIAGAPSKTVVLQESIGDCQVPNVATEMLARSIGVTQLEPHYEPVFPLPEVERTTTGATLAQYYLISDVDKYVPPPNNTIPTEDNGAHFDLNFQPQVQAQIIQFLTTGVIQQPCPGVCEID